MDEITQARFEEKLKELESQGEITIRDKGITQLEPNTITCVNLGIYDLKDVPEVDNIYQFKDWLLNNTIRG